MTSLVFIDEIITKYFCEIGQNFKSSLKPGQLVWTYFFYNYESLELWRPADLDDSSTIARKFEIRTDAKDRFSRRIPLYSPRLEIDEEFPVIRAKRRPALLVTSPPPEINVANIRGGERINQGLCLAAPLFSLSSEEGKTKFHTELINRVRKLLYPHLFFIPRFEEAGIKDSFCRLDRIASSFVSHMAPEDLCLAGEACELFFSQLSFYIGGDSGQFYKTAFQLFNQK